jgi:alkylation response protein AidB-like acyl-CoA dehydrogenase
VLTRPSPVVVPESEQPWIDLVSDLAGRFAGLAAEVDATGELPERQLRALNSCGLDVAFLPVEHGGEGLSYATLGNVVRMLAAADPSVATVWLMHLGAAHALVTSSTPSNAAFYAAELTAGRRFSNALSEPSGGNMFLTPLQNAVPTEGGWSLSGSKRFVSGSEIADHFLINASVEGEPAFFGLATGPTITLTPIWDTMGMRGTRSQLLGLDGTLLRADLRCAAPDPGYTNLISAGFAFLSIGIAEAALDAARQHALSRTIPSTGQPLAQMQWVRFEMATAWAEVRAARLLAEQTMWLADRRDPQAVLNATEAKLLANEVAKRAAAFAVKVGGGSGYLNTSPIQRIFRDAQAGALMAFSVEVSQDLVGGWVLAENP